MDKVRLLNRISALSSHFCAGQRLRESGMNRGQKIGLQQKSRFCTSDAVDIQQFVHSLDRVLADCWSVLCILYLALSWLFSPARFFFEERFQNGLQVGA